MSILDKSNLQIARRAWWTATLFGVALALRIAVAMWLGLATPPAPGSDDAEYVAYATSLAEHGDYRGMSPDVADQNHLTAYRPPGPSLVYAALFRMFGRRFDVIRLSNCLWGALACVVLLAIGREVATEKVAWLAAIGWAIYPRALLFSGTLVSESLGLLLFLGFFLAALRFARRAEVSASILAGVLLGLAILVQPARVFMLPFVVLWAVFAFRHRVRMLAVSLAIPVAAVIAVLPWSIRNYVVFHQVIPLSTSGGSALLQGNNRVVVTDPEYFGYSVWDTSIPEYADTLRHAGNEITRDQLAGKFAIDWLKANTRYWPFLVKAKLVRGFTPILQARTPRLYRWAELLSWGPVLVLMLIGFAPTWIRASRTGGGGWLIHLAILHFVVITVVFFGNSRYRYAVEPLCLLIAVMTAVWLTGLLRPAQRRTADA